MRKLMAGVLGLMFTLSMLSAQEPTCKNCPGTYISVNEVQAYVKRAMDNNLVDQQIRAVEGAVFTKSGPFGQVLMQFPEGVDESYVHRKLILYFAKP